MMPSEIICSPLKNSIPTNRVAQPATQCRVSTRTPSAHTIPANDKAAAPKPA